MRTRSLMMLLALGLLSACSAEVDMPTGDEEIEELGLVGLKADGASLREADLTLEPGKTKRYRVSGADIRIQFTQTSQDVDVQVSAKNYEIDEYSDISAEPNLVVLSPGDELRRWTIRVKNVGDETLEGRVEVSEHVEAPPAPVDARVGKPSLNDDVLVANEFCTYADSAPYVASVKWDHPAVQAAMSAMAPGWRSMFSYSQWSVPAGLESDRNAPSDEAKRDIRARNFIRVLCMEHRDYPEMLARKLEVVGNATHMAGPEDKSSFDTDENLFTQMTYRSYERLTNVLGRMHTARSRRGANDGYHYGFGDDDDHSNRVDHSVAPTTHCEMKFIFENYLVAGSSNFFSTSTYERNYEDYKAGCSADDLDLMYNFRGHVNFQPLWLESNAFIHNSRRARYADRNHRDRSYYMRPFASRYHAAKGALGSMLFYPDDVHDEMISASNRGGGPIVYITDQDANGDNLQDFKLFDEQGCGDQGVSRPVPSQNCNMVDWQTALHTDNIADHADDWDPAYFELPGMGFTQTFGDFETRMGRFNALLDRHTNWGPTSYYAVGASKDDDESPYFWGAYSPIVAASYDVSASDFFVRRDYSSTHSYEQGRAKWLFVMRFRASDYYDETDMRGGRELDFDRHYFNETSLSNDYYDERALDRFGYVPNGDMYAQVYLTYGHAGDQPPAAVTVPAP